MGSASLEASCETEAHHAAELFGKGVAHHRNHSLGAERDKGIGEGVIARDHLEPLRLVVDYLLDLL